jgi:replicative DNA helicase
LELAKKAFEKLPIYIYDDPYMTIERICSYTRQAVIDGQCGLAVVDYTQLVNVGATSGDKRSKVAMTRQMEVTHIVRELRRLAVEADVPVISLSQMNDEGLMRESRDIKNEAAVLAVLKCLDNKDEAGYAEKEFRTYDVDLDKVREGEAGKVPFEFHHRYTRFDEMVLNKEF